MILSALNLQPMILPQIAIWSIAVLSIAGVIARPGGAPEALYAAIGAGLILAFALISPADGLSAVQGGIDVYLFLAGMMLLAELARNEGVFDWLASCALRAAGTSRWRLFGIIYLVGTIVTVFLSNDATAVVLTPAVAAVVTQAEIDPRPYVFACAFIANAASFVLPISNPGNLVVFGAQLPALGIWLQWFLASSLAAIAATIIAHALTERRELQQPLAIDAPTVVLTRTGKIGLISVILAAMVMTGVSVMGIPLGAPTLAVAVLAMIVIAAFGGTSPLIAIRHVSWQSIALVGALFVLVRAMEHAGARDALQASLTVISHLHHIGTYGTAFFVSAICNIGNNLPVGMLVGDVLTSGFSAREAHAAAIGVDLGPNFSITGSLATILWLVALRRYNLNVTFFQFFRVGVLVTPSALLLAVAFVR